MLHSVAENSSESSFTSFTCGLGKSGTDLLNAHLKIEHTGNQPLCVVSKYGLPDSSNILIQFNKYDVISEILEGGCESDCGTSRKRLN